jgi:hypothetical protein
MDPKIQAGGEGFLTGEMNCLNSCLKPTNSYLEIHAAKKAGPSVNGPAFNEVFKEVVT